MKIQLPIQEQDYAEIVWQGMLEKILVLIRLMLRLMLIYVDNVVLKKTK